MSLSLALLGGLLALDGTSVGQFMVSRPLVAGTLAGWWLGDPVLGLEVGAILELFHLAGVPAGGAHVPESGPASVVAVAVAMSAGGPGGLALAVVAGLAFSECVWRCSAATWHRSPASAKGSSSRYSWATCRDE